MILSQIWNVSHVVSGVPRYRPQSVPSLRTATHTTSASSFILTAYTPSTSIPGSRPFDEIIDQ